MRFWWEVPGLREGWHRQLTDAQTRAGEAARWKDEKRA